MKCVLCSSDVEEAQYIAIDDNGDPQVMCEECFQKVRIFFQEVRRRGKAKSRRSVARSE